MGARSAIPSGARRDGCRGEFPPRQERPGAHGPGAGGVCLQFRPLVSADRQKEFRDPQRQNHLRLSSSEEPQGGHGGWAAGGGAATLRGLPSQTLGQPAPPRHRVCLSKGEGCPTSLPMHAEGSPPDAGPALRPHPAHRSRPLPARGGERGSAATGVLAWKVRGWVRSAPWR